MTGSITVRRQKVRKPRCRYKLACLLMLAAALLLALLFIERLCPHDPNAQVFAALEPPSAAHPAGTDRLGRDLLSRILIGLRTSVLSSLALVTVTAAAGSAAGVLSGYFGGLADSLLMRIADVCLAFPGLVLGLAVAALLGGGLHNAVLALAVVSWPKYARVARSQTLALLRTDHMAAARLAGGSAPQLILRHILPNCAGPLLVTAMLDIGAMMMELAGLSFLGLGAMPPTAELGSMMSGGRSLLQLYPWVVIGPGIAIFAAVAFFNLLGDAARDWLDPQNSGGK